ncbi:RAC-alpha serine/threonine-protein kinase [Pyrenophora tritici-repentis Pt-1C-BFP]|uniref:non-specific serine/threonine protein kinase n=1 Tax=Pyrenophora tritici-repentis (strain Pt-1C-BFP) TaxID=426418 RepID=B2VW93_PYRTR|nr:RAC-alpha serine/threonine-protein kinase [Pyrenophora tritici-repentis Pt-1C-BFP]EDU40893.1 RAC-alpha serine/threonine-protein kinase [Pyrenophora tritici-repentis Pt-1C-BFP]
MGQNSGKPVVFTDQVNLNHFRLLRVVGKGAFGKVRIVERKDTGLTFALKYIRKDEVVRSESVRNIIRERRMLEHLNHPFLCNLRYSFQDIEYLYIVVDLMNGGDLRFHISRKTFTEEAQGIVHRDIKPDNVLLDSEGHVHLADFNVASDFVPHKPLTSKSGTLAYLAPEVYEGKGYSCEVDWWSLGVLFYECIYNKRPFEASSHDSLAAKILKGEPTYPVTSPPVSMPCLHAISSLLEKNRKKRIGAIGFESFIDNPFFRPIDFVALERKEIPPIFVPSSDKTNFDATYDLEELLLEEAPLEARARRQKPREALKDDATEQEIRAEELHRMIETLFEPFNYTTAGDQRTPAAVAVIDPQDSTAGSRASNQSQPDNTSASATSQVDPWGRPLANTKSQDGELHPTRSTTTARSTQSPNGSPPLPTSALNQASNQAPHTASPTSQRGEHVDYFPTDGTEVPTPSFSRPMNQRQRGSQRSTSMGGGVQVVLNETGSWTEMANQSSALVQNAQVEKPSGMLGFLSRKKGRDRSPKAKERGVLGKEGARVIISNT